MKHISISAETKKTMLVFGLLLLLQACLLTCICMEKQGFHMDEYFTFCLSNNEHGAKNPTEIGKIYDSSYFTDYLAVEEGQSFSYRQVWINQKNDVHPPLYYVFIHTLSSLFPGKFLPWLGLGFNIAVSLGITVCLYFLYQCFFKNQRLSLVLAFGTSLLAGMAECVLFIRMYELAMFFVLFHSLIHVKYYANPRKIFYVELFFCSAAGALTHYYVIVYMFFIGLFYGLHLLYQRQIKPFLSYAATMAFAGLFSLLLFPWMTRHLFSTNRGEESLSNIQNFGDLGERFKTFGDFVNTQLFAGCFWGLMVFFFFCLWLRRKHKQALLWPSELSMLTFAAACFFLFVAKSSSYKEERYVFMIYPVIFLVTITALVNLHPDKEKMAAAALILCITVSGSHADFNFPLKYEKEAAQQEKLENYKDSFCIVVSDLENYYRILPSFGQLSSFAHVVFLQVDSLENLKAYGLTEIEDTLIYVQNDFSRPKDVCKTIIKENPGLNDFEKLFSSEYMEVYHAW